MTTRLIELRQLGENNQEEIELNSNDWVAADKEPKVIIDKNDSCEKEEHIKSSTNVIVSDNKYFCVDYCKRGSTKCKVCKKHIPKDELRIGKSVLFKTKTIIQFYHINCAFKSFEKVRVETNVITCTDDIDGINSIDEIDRNEINEMVTELHTKRIDKFEFPVRVF